MLALNLFTSLHVIMTKKTNFRDKLRKINCTRFCSAHTTTEKFCLILAGGTHFMKHSHRLVISNRSTDRVTISHFLCASTLCETFVYICEACIPKTLRVCHHPDHIALRGIFRSHLLPASARPGPVAIISLALWQHLMRG